MSSILNRFVPLRGVYRVYCRFAAVYGLRPVYEVYCRFAAVYGLRPVYEVYLPLRGV
jgi:hypothetical protein